VSSIDSPFDNDEDSTPRCSITAAPRRAAAAWKLRIVRELGSKNSSAITRPARLERRLGIRSAAAMSSAVSKISRASASSTWSIEIR